MKYVLITGSCGLVGSEAVRFFRKKQFHIIGIDNNLRSFFFGKDGSTNWIKLKLLSEYKNYYNHFNIDIRNFSKLEKIFKSKGKKIKLIIHAAAQPSHDWATKKPLIDFNVNSTGTLNLLMLTKKYCSKKTPFIYMSTNKVYGDNPNRIKLVKRNKRFSPQKKSRYLKGINETMSLDSCVHSLFGVSKLSADLLVQEYGKNFNMNTVNFRAGCITGPNHSSAKLHGFLSYLVKSCLKEKKYTVIGHSGLQVRDNLHSEDLINCFWEFYKKPKKGAVYNIGGGFKNSCSVLEAINFVQKKIKYKIKIQFVKTPRTGDHLWWITDNRKFFKDYKNYKIKYNLRKTLEEMILSIKH